jgi:hypothetical protein
MYQHPTNTQFHCNRKVLKHSRIQLKTENHYNLNAKARTTYILGKLKQKLQNNINISLLLPSKLLHILNTWKWSTYDPKLLAICTWGTPITPRTPTEATPSCNPLRNKGKFKMDVPGRAHLPRKILLQHGYMTTAWPRITKQNKCLGINTLQIFPIK